MEPIPSILYFIHTVFLELKTGNTTSFKNRLKELREDCAFTQAALAKKIGVSGNMISNYESGTNAPSIDILSGLSKVLNCSTDYLLGLTSYRGVDPRSYEYFELLGGLEQFEREVIFGQIEGYLIYRNVLKKSPTVDNEYIKRLVS